MVMVAPPPNPRLSPAGRSSEMALYDVHLPCTLYPAALYLVHRYLVLPYTSAPCIPVYSRATSTSYIVHTYRYIGIHYSLLREVYIYRYISVLPPRRARSLSSHLFTHGSPHLAVSLLQIYPRSLQIYPRRLHTRHRHGVAPPECGASCLLTCSAGSRPAT